MLAEAERERHFLGLGESSRQSGRRCRFAPGSSSGRASRCAKASASRPSSDEACACVTPGHRAGQGERCTTPLGKQHGHALVFTQQAVLPARVHQMGGEERVHPIAVHPAETSAKYGDAMPDLVTLATLIMRLASGIPA